MHCLGRLIGPGIGRADDRLRTRGKTEHHSTIHRGDEGKRVPISHTLPRDADVCSLAAVQPSRAFATVEGVLPDAGGIDDYPRAELPAFAGVLRSRDRTH